MTLGAWALLPASDDVLDELVEMGREDARRWAKRNGWGGEEEEGSRVETETETEVEVKVGGGGGVAGM